MTLASAILAALLTLVPGVVNAHPEILPPCATEDSAGPCYWDATTRGTGSGKGHGQPFWVDAAQRIHYLPTN
ncbi:hypothetical protein [Micromonospora sp. NPDC048839]|uniref:hypothetical protein n=1 Tax=Micromonospora sp. NPDC048839 TaxID=3155641 RepID=UPI003407A1B7